MKPEPLKPERSAEEQAEFDKKQSEARAAAAAAQKDREARLAEQKDKKPETTDA